MSEPTFRDFAGAILSNDLPAASTLLETLLGLSPERASGAAGHFKEKMADPSFLPKAMGLRTAVTEGTDASIAELLGDCFGLAEGERAAAVAVLRQRYPRVA